MLPDYLMERQSPDKDLHVSGDTTVPLHKRYVRASASGNETATITLPNVTEAKDRRFVVSAVTVGARTNDRVAVNYTNGTGAALTTGIGTTGVEIEFQSDGHNWVVHR